MTTKIETKSAELTANQQVGKELLKKFKAHQKADYSRIENWDLPMGKLILSLESEMDEGQSYLSKSVLKEHFLDQIPRQRRNTAKKLAENWNHEVMAELHKSKRFTSAETLLREFVKQTSEEETPNKTAEQLAKAVATMLKNNSVQLDAFAKALVAEYAAQSEETTQDIPSSEAA